MRVLLSIFLAFCVALPAQAQAPRTAAGFTPSAHARLRSLDSLLLANVDTARLGAAVRTLSGWARVAGTPGQQHSADYVLREMASAGLDTSRADFRIWLPYPDSTVVERLEPQLMRLPLRLALEERPIPGDSASAFSTWRAMNGYAGAGDVRGDLVYVNYGLAQDYQTLDSLGVSAKGKVVLARYGRSFRGIKAREAERNGALALLLYSDPADDGYVRGDVYPQGPMRHPEAVQRGSVYLGDGDPSTPGWASVAGARRVPAESLAVPRIPVVPIGYQNAMHFLAALTQGSVPQSWQGGLPLRYHTGKGEVKARVGLWREEGERAFKQITNTFGTLQGSEFPDELVLIGGHRDSWGPGAADNASGTATVLEVARSFAAAARAGYRPKRTLVFATWDAEEWGLIGSSEWVEQEAERLAAHAIAYINLDMMATGRDFGAEASGSLHALLREVTHLVRAPGDTVAVFERWSAPRGPRRAEPPIDDLGGGSDYTGFYNHLGIASLGLGFGGPQGIYHSSYDTPDYVERFGDPGYRSHRAAAQVSALLLARLAFADVVPLDYVDWARRMADVVAEVERDAGTSARSLPLAELKSAIRELQSAAEQLRNARDRRLAGDHAPTQSDSLTRVLVSVERAVVRNGGIPGRPFMQNLLFASDRDDGYATVALPAITEALRDRDQALARREVLDLTLRIRTATDRLQEARKLLSKT